MHNLQLIVLSALPMASAFLNNLFKSESAFLNNLFKSDLEINPKLHQLIDNQSDKKLNIQLLIGDPDESLMVIQDLVFELHREVVDYEHAILPGADGQHGHLSSGHRRLDLVSEGHFINIQGTQQVKTQGGCWEIVWCKDKPAGNLICGFEVPQEYQRNDALLPKSTIHLNFPLWTAEGLKVGQEEKKKVEEQARQCMCDRDEALYYYETTENPIMKAIHFRNVNAAVDEYNELPHDVLESIPDDNNILELQDDILLATNGFVYARLGSNHPQSHAFLGRAKIIPEAKKNRLMP